MQKQATIFFALTFFLSVVLVALGIMGNIPAELALVLVLLVQIVSSILIFFIVVRPFLKRVTGFLQALQNAKAQNGSIVLKEPLQQGNTQDELNQIAVLVEQTLLEANKAIQQQHLQADETTELVNDIIAREKANQRQLTNTFKILSDSMHQLASGSLDVDVDPNNGGIARKLFEDYNTSIEVIRSMVLRILESVSGSVLISQDIAVSAGNVLEVSKAQEEMSGFVADAAGQVGEVVTSNTRSTTHAAEIAKTAMKLAEEGARKLEATDQSTERIVVATDKTGQMLDSLANNIEDISSITQTINEIADQTNLLALNAAIEAARAGDQGRGFAVVADEVRKLAERTTQATKEISSKIRIVRADSVGATKAMRESQDAVKEGSRLNGELATNFANILSNIENVVQNISHVAIATEEQYATVQAIIEQINNLAEQAKDANMKITEISGYAESLTMMNENLKDSVDFFKFDSSEDTSTLLGMSAGATKASQLSL
ncbi:MAG: methyl-accepting chemotaxis protein [Candidatus Kapaibacterium sp.]|nr:MAG: methyl-accepting chemotaxis protein [Candidatus Kapabacteria bacterium]